MNVLGKVRDLCRRTWTWGPPTEHMKTAWAVRTNCDGGQFGLAASWQGDEEGLGVTVMIGPLLVTVDGPPLPGADDDFGAAGQLDWAGRTWQLFVTRDMTGVAASWVSTDAADVVNIKVGSVGLNVIRMRT